jgi:hypothetical protein
MVICRPTMEFEKIVGKYFAVIWEERFAVQIEVTAHLGGKKKR